MNPYNTKYCPYCLPIKRRFHFPFYVECYANHIIAPLAQIAKRLGLLFSPLMFHKIWGFLLEALRLFHIAKFETNPKQEDLPNMALIFFKEAQKRGLKIEVVKILNHYTNNFKFYYKGRSFYYEVIPLSLSQSRPSIIDNKAEVKKLFQENGLPVAKGRAFFSEKKAIRFAETLGYPLVVKPTEGSLTHHVTCNIQNQEELKKAIRIAKIYSPQFVVEEHIEGNLYRGTVLGQKELFLCQRERANVVGDGRSSIKELVRVKNQDPRRGKLAQKNTTLYQIPIDRTTEYELQKQGMTWQSVPESGKKVYLQEKIILSLGCDIINCKDQAHPDNLKLFLKAAQVLDADLVGIDFLCPDISISYKKQKTTLLEGNSRPHLDMHQFPSHGASEPVAEKVWEILLEQI